MKIYKTITRLIKEAWKIDKKYFLYLGILAVLQTIISLALTYLPSGIISYIEEGKGLNQALLFIGVLLGVIFLLKILASFFNARFSKLANYQSESLEIKIAEHTMDLSYDHLENTETLDLIQRAKIPIKWGLINVALNTIKDFTINISLIFGLAILLLNYSIPYGSLVIVILLIGFLLNIYLQRRHDIIIQKNVPVNRKYGFYLDEAMHEKNQKDFRLFNISKLWMSKIEQYTVLIFKWLKSVYKSGTNKEVVQFLVSSIITFIAISYNGTRLFTTTFGPLISVATFTLIYNSTYKLMTSLQEIGTSIANLNMANAHLTPWKDFLDLKSFEDKGTLEARPLETLEFKNVSFTYPHSDKLILDKVSFKINKGDKISIVGLNNAGKSTIVKLISRFYQPDSGEILWNGHKIEAYGIDSYTKQISAVFQDFKLLPYTIFENILHDSNDRKKAEDSLRDVNMYEEVSSLPKGMDTYLDKTLENDATRFSGGQEQKLAIARAINKGGSLMIMDEPTAALDPVAEAEIFEKFADLTKNRTSIFISHRMSTSTFSDKIILLDGGKIVAFDSHKNLMEGHNLYRELFETQAKHYK